MPRNHGLFCPEFHNTSFNAATTASPVFLPMPIIGATWMIWRPPQSSTSAKFMLTCDD